MEHPVVHSVPLHLLNDGVLGAGDGGGEGGDEGDLAQERRVERRPEVARVLQPLKWSGKSIY